jgi:GntR family transcriptional regulator/MocR family aminotransferase
MAVAPEQMLILSSSVMAVNVVAQAFLGAEGGVVLVENPGNPAVWETLRQSPKAEIKPLAVDQQGAQLEALLECLQPGRSPVKLLVLSPQCHYPTGVSLSEARRVQFLELSRQHRFPILELDSEYDYLPVGRPSRPLAVDAPGQVIYVGNLSRIMAPGVRASYLVAPEALSNLLARARRTLDWQGDPIQEWALSELLLEGEIERQLHRVRKAVSERREALEDALRHAFAGRIAFDPGAMALWLRGIGPLADPGAFTTWVKGCQSRGLKLRTGRHYDLPGQERAATRFGYTAYTPEELQRAVASMA